MSEAKTTKAAKGLFPKTEQEPIKGAESPLFDEQENVDKESGEILEEQHQEQQQTEAQKEFNKDVPDLPTAQESADYDAMMAKAFAARESGEMTEVTGSYLALSDFKLGEKRVFIFTGMTTFTKPDTGEDIPAALLKGEDKVNYVCASAVVTSSLARLKNVPCAVIIVSNGKKKSAKGNYYDASVYTV